jgi:hypothetical protein
VASTTPLQKLKMSPDAKDGTDLVISELSGSELCMKRKAFMTHDLRFKPCVVCTLHNRVIEIIGVALVLILKLVKEVEEVE